ncbi:inactive beta-amylase 4, chloroplastic isoform X2 [Alnus glutinosa]|uniref:inactive beta-amylase 4, chloroplastic isoform X2 n=1 Tax=Alnus glutinosa TaxID=3517 RepID=UPI002D767971|nr:inactive beta-amylase 4, chloroplastic isoform X2 [Alnus glutinosa]
MGMIESGGVACKCTGSRSYGFREATFHENRIFLSNLRNDSMTPLLRNGLCCSRWPSVAGARTCILSIDGREKSRSTILSSRQKRVPLYVMMPVDTFGIDTSGSPRIRKIKALTVSLKALKLAGVHGIAVEVWWGIVERFSPLAYNWSLYEELFQLISQMGLKLHVALSFHSNRRTSSSGSGDVSLPLWILEIGEHNKDIYYRDQNGFSNDAYLTLGVDQIPLFCGRTALQCYEDFMFSFVNKFDSFIGSVIEEISVGLGPSGELRYPAHPFGDGRWKFPGIGEFQCYDKYMMEDLRMTAAQEGKPEWGDKGPQNAGYYNSLPSGVPFFGEGEEGFLSDYGRFFLEWYSCRLIQHADAILAKAANILKKYQENKRTSVILVAKIGGIYWWYRTVSHPAELTSGYYNTACRDGYDPIALMLSRHGAALHISCLEMLDSETPPAYLCSPEGLLEQIQTVSKRRTIHLIGRNANEQFDKAGLCQIYANCYHPKAVVRALTFFRMNDKIFRVENWKNFVPFVRNMSTGL